VYDLVYKERLLNDVVLNVGGLHNVENSVAAMAVAMWLQIDPEKVRTAVASFRGVKRRAALHRRGRTHRRSSG
jgi:UDP-N-acetylmuramate--alanine ligase